MAFLCGTGCGFFGSPENRGLCSKCYAAHLRKETAKFTAAIVGEEQVAADRTAGAIFGEEQFAAAPSEVAIVNKKKRCGSCNKKIGIVGFRCRCGDRFCGAHKYPNEHGCPCSFDYKGAGRAVIRDENPLCKADKMAYRI